MKKTAVFFGILLCALCLFLTAGAAGEHGAQVSRLPARLNVIGEEAFAGSAFEVLAIPEGIRSIGEGAFADMPNLTELRFADNTQLFTGRESIRLSGRREKPETPFREDGIRNAAAVPAARQETNRTPGAEKSAGTAEDTQNEKPRPGRDGGEPDESPRTCAALHPLDLRFP